MVLVPFIIAGAVITIKLSQELLKISEARAVHLADDLAYHIDTKLRQELKLISTIAGEPALVQNAITGDYLSIQKRLASLQERIGHHYFSILLLDRNGIVQADPVFQQIGLNLSDREYFQKAKKGHANVSGPLIARGDLTKGVPILVIAAPLFHEQQFFGMVAILFDFDLMIKITSEIKFEKTGYGFIIDDKGLILIHPRKEFILDKRLPDLPGSEEIQQVLADTKAGVASYSFEGEKKIAGFSPVAITGWIAAFCQNREEIMNPVNRTLQYIFSIAFAFLILTVIGIVFFFSKLSSPIQKMMALMAQLTRHSPEMILQIGLDRKIIHANKAYETITGEKVETVINREPILDNPAKFPAEAIWKLLEEGSSWSGRVILKRNMREPVPLDVMIIPLLDEKGVKHGYVEIGRDVTTELLFEKRLQQGQKLEAIGTLAGGIAHDFNNILSGIFGYAELALMKKADDPDTRTYIRRIMQASGRARDLVGQILTFSRQTEVELKPLRPQIVLKEALKLLRASIPATIDIRTKLDSEAFILADPTQIHQVVMNLFTNAAHAIGNNTGSVELELVDFVVDKAFAQAYPNVNEGNHVLIRISDTGSGIPSEVIENVFEPFFTTKSQGEGTGLGLSMVHGIVRQLGGTISVESQEGQGTTFSILIPSTQGGKPSKDSGDLDLNRGNAQVMVVDDEQDIARILQAILSHLGYRISAFTDANLALEKIVANPGRFDLIITDYAMPNLTGLEFARRLEEAGIDLPVIMISGYLIEEIEGVARQTCIAEFISKPIDTYRLAEAIQRALKGRSSQSNQQQQT